MMILFFITCMSVLFFRLTLHEESLYWHLVIKRFFFTCSVNTSFLHLIFWHLRGLWLFCFLTNFFVGSHPSEAKVDDMVSDTFELVAAGSFFQRAKNSICAHVFSWHLGVCYTVLGFEKQECFHLTKEKPVVLISIFTHQKCSEVSTIQHSDIPCLQKKRCLFLHKTSTLCNLWCGDLLTPCLCLAGGFFFNVISHEFSFCMKMSCQKDLVHHYFLDKRKCRSRQLQHQPFTERTRDGVHHSALTRLPCGSLISHLCLPPHLVILLSSAVSEGSVAKTKEDKRTSLVENTCITQKQISMTLTDILLRVHGVSFLKTF